MGEVMRAAAFAKFEKVPVEKGMGTIVVERMMDVLCLLAAIGIAFILEFDKLWGWLSENMGSGNSEPGSSFNPILIIVASIFILMLIAFLIFKKQIQQTNFYKKIIKIIKGFWEGISSVWKLDNPWLFIFHSVFIWVMYYAMTFLCFYAFEPTAHLSLTAGLMVFVFGAFGIVIPSPGGMGTYHWLAIAALSFYSIDPITAFSFANISFFSIQIFCNISMGIVSVILLFILNKNYSPKHVKPISDATNSTKTDSVLDA